MDHLACQVDAFEASLLWRHGDSRRLATLLATTVYLASRAVADAVDMLKVLIATRLLWMSATRPARSS
ncbi:hypothetical protein [Streptomyces sp. NPDC055036]